MATEINEGWRSKYLTAQEHPGPWRARVRDLIVEHVDAENAKDEERVNRTYADACVFVDVPAGVRFEGKAAIARSYGERYVAYPTLERIITRLTVDDRSAVAEITMRGVQEAVYRGFPPTGRVQKLDLVGHFELNADCLITRETAYYDRLQAAVALGALPDLSSPSGRIWLALARPQLLLRQLRARLMS